MTGQSIKLVKHLSTRRSTRPGGEVPATVRRPSAWRWARRAAIGLGLFVALIAAASWWFTAPLEPLEPVAEPNEPGAAEAESAVETVLAWPEHRVEGLEAKRLLLDFVLAARTRLQHVSGYTATFRRQERLRGKLGPVQVAQMKVRHHPFAVYLKFLTPDAGKEVLYAEGRYDGKVMAHPGGWGRHLLPRLVVKPDSALAMADNRHPVTDAGLVNLTKKLVLYREMDLHDPEAETVLDWVTDADGERLPRSIHRHPLPKKGRLFALVEVWYDPETFIPLRIQSHDWPASAPNGPVRDEDCPLAECYEYDDLVLDPPLNALDFDPTNPAYEFQRF